MSPIIVGLMLLSFTLQPCHSTPTFSWLNTGFQQFQNFTSNFQGQFQQFQNLTSSFLPNISSFQAQTQSQGSFPRVRICKIVTGCVKEEDCVAEGNGVSYCSPDADKLECWLDDVGCVIRKKVSACVCGPAGK